MSYVIKHKKTGMYAGPDGSRALALRFDTYGEAARELGCFTVKNDWREHARIFYLGRKRNERRPAEYALKLALLSSFEMAFRVVAAEAKVQDLAAHIRRLEEELGHNPKGSGAV